MPEPVLGTCLQGRLLHCVNLPVPISCPDGLNWSEDHQLAIATRKGVYVFDLVPDASKTSTKLSFVKTFIENDTEVNPWQLEVVVPDDVMSTLPRETRNRISMDRVMSPHMAAGETNFRQPSRVGWTPRNISSPDRSCLITLTVDHRLRLFKQSGRCWLPEIDLSQLLLLHIKRQPMEVKQGEMDKFVSEVERRAYSLATSCFTWAGNDQLVTGQMSGHLVVYSVETTTDVRVVDVLSTELGGPVSCVHYVEIKGVSVMLVGGLDGRVMAFTGQNYNVNLGFVWADPDRLSVSKINTYIDHQTSKWFVLLAKGNFCIRVGLSVSRGRMEVSSDTKHVNVGMTRIVGMEWLNDKLILANQRGPDMTTWDLSGDCSKGRLQVTEVERQHYWCYGMAVSPNRCIIACLENISSFNDHLIMREPGRLVFWTLDTQTSVVARLKTGDYGPDLLDTQRVLSLTTYTRECMEVPVAGDTGEIQLRVDWWRLSVQLARCPLNAVELQTRLELCEVGLRTGAALSCLNGVKEEEYMARVASANFIIAFSDDQEIKELASLAMSSEPGLVWSCLLCGSGEINSPKVRSVTCTSGHSWPRCVLTQQAVTVSDPLTCSWCKSPALPPDCDPSKPTDDISPDESSSEVPCHLPCSLCRGPLVHS